jgi:tetratricopeptide (TPR) repeat protein
VAKIGAAVIQRFRQIINWLGPTRAQILFFLLALTGLGSLMLSAVGQSLSWVRIIQSGLLIVFLVGSAIVVLSRFPRDERSQYALAVMPTVAGLSLAILFPHLAVFFVAISLGWPLIALISSRGRMDKEYRPAIKHMRNGQYNEAIKIISDLIDAQPDKAEHYLFRAQLYRLSNKLKKARGDYQKVIELTPDAGAGYNGMAEVYLQDGDYEQALVYGKQALEWEPGQWVAPYNLGMIEDRLNAWPDAITHLKQALKIGIPESRHRMLTHLWLARAAYHQGQTDEATAEVEHMKRERSGLNEWKVIFESEEAAALRSTLLKDVELAVKFVEHEAALDVLEAGA